MAGMSAIISVHMAGTALVPVLAWAVARRQRSHVPLAAYLTWLAVVDGVNVALRGGIYQTPSHPMHGWARAAFHVDDALSQSTQFFFLACILHYFLGRGARWPIALWAVVVTLRASRYPASVSWPAFAMVFNATALFCWLVIVFAILTRRELKPTISHVVLILYSATDAVAAAFPLLRLPSSPSTTWHLVMVCATIGVAAVIVAHLVALWRLRSDAPDAAPA